MKKGHPSTRLPTPSASPKQTHANNLPRLKRLGFWCRYAHRMWGRVLGLAFAVPCTYFAARGYITSPLAARLGVLFTLGGCQGLVGWWMVKSGLEVRRHDRTPSLSSPHPLEM